MRSPESLKKKNRNQYASRSPEKRLYLRAKTRALRKNIRFEIQVSDVSIPEYCPVLGLKLSFNNKQGGDYNSPSLDRIDPKKGYVKGNVRVISMRANTLKSNATLEEMKLIVDDLEKIYDHKQL